MQRGEAPIRTRFAAPVVLSAMIVVCAVAAHFLNRPVWGAVIGAAIALLYWALEAVIMRIGAKVPANTAVAVAAVGSVVRLAVIFSLLVAVALLWRPVFATALTAFVVSFSVYLGLRIISFPLARGPLGTVKAQ